MMTRQEILDLINKTILEEHGNELVEEDLLANSNIDSFGYAVLWITVEQEVGSKIPREIEDAIDYKEFTVSDFINLLIEYKICS